MIKTYDELCVFLNGYCGKAYAEECTLLYYTILEKYPRIEMFRTYLQETDGEEVILSALFDKIRCTVFDRMFIPCLVTQLYYEMLGGNARDRFD